MPSPVRRWVRRSEIVFVISAAACRWRREGRRKETRTLTKFADPSALDGVGDPNAESIRDASIVDWDTIERGEHPAWLVFRRRLLSACAACLALILPPIESGTESHTFIARSLSEVDVHEDAGLNLRWKLSDGRSHTLAILGGGRPVGCSWRSADLM